MNQSLNLKTTTLALRNWISLETAGRGFLCTVLLVACFVFSQTVKAQDGDEMNGNTAEGQGALSTYISTANSSSDDTAIGLDTLQFNTTGTQNTAIGAGALQFNTTGNANTATGSIALFNNTMGNDNTAAGLAALFNNTTGSNNTATGFQALFSNNADNNTATGGSALYSNTTGSFNTATGLNALNSNTTGSENTATGAAALTGNTTGNNNTATGEGALLANKTGSNNTATGLSALESNTAGSNNTADGVEALLINTGNSNTAAGYFALINNKTGSNNIALGANAGFNLTTGSNNIDIGNAGVTGEANIIRIGKQGTQAATFIAGIFSKGVASASGVNVKIDSTGKLGTVLSSARYKEAIKPMDKASESILKLEPITFRYKKEFDPDGVTQFGLVAEDVEKVCPDLVVRDEEGKPMTVRYDAVNAMLLNEFLKEHRKVEEQQKEIAAIAAQLKEQKALIQKVSDRLETTKAPPQLVATTQ